MEPAQALRSLLERLAGIIADSDQARLAPGVRALLARLQTAPCETAREVMEQVTANVIPTVLTHGGEAYKPEGPARELAFEYARLRAEAYDFALQLWHATRRRERQGWSATPEKITEYPGCAEIWRYGGRHIARYDCGSHFSLFRDDEISADEAAQAALGPLHFSRMVIALQNRLTAAGIDAWAGSAVPPPEPPEF